MRNKFFLSGGIMLNSGFLSFDWSVMSSVMHPFTDLPSTSHSLDTAQQVKQTRAKLGSTTTRCCFRAPFTSLGTFSHVCHSSLLDRTLPKWTSGLAGRTIRGKG